MREALGRPTRGDVLGGITTFLTMAYIVVVNPSILATEGTGMPFNGVLTATVLLCTTMTLLMGLYARLPFGVAPGMGINAFFAYTIVLGQHVRWQVALGMVFWAGVLFLLVSVTPLREQIARAIPKNLRVGAGVGIGLFLTFIGLKNAGIVAADPATFVRIGHFGADALVFGIGLLVAAVLLARRSAFAFLASIAAATIVALIAGTTHVPASMLSMPDFGAVFFRLDVVGALSLALAPAIISVMFTDLFDSISTFVGVAGAANLVDADGHPKNLRQGLIVDALATLTAGLFGTSSGTAFIESAAGIEVGGRSGWTAVVTALCFLPCLFVGPLAGMVPAAATAPVLVLVGALMFRSVRTLELGRFEDAVPPFVTIALIPLTFSITQGLLWGFITHTVLYVLTGRARDISPMLWVIAAISVALIVLGQR